jgi:hypothetical protein
MIDELTDDEDGVDDEARLVSARAEEDERAGRQEPQLRRAAAGVLQAARVVELLAEDERVGVLPPRAVPALDEKRLVEEVRPVGNAIDVAIDRSRLWLPLAPEDDLALRGLAPIEVAATALQKLAPVRIAIPELEVAIIGPVLTARMDELHEAGALTHERAPGCGRRSDASR